MIPQIENVTFSKELSRRILITLGLLIVYRLGIHVPVPGINTGAIADFFASAQNTLFGLFDMFAGGGLSKFSVFALGIMPYISAAIIMELLVVVSPELEKLKKRKKVRLAEGKLPSTQGMVQYLSP